MIAAGDRKRQASYCTSAGSRHLVAQRIGGRVALIDEPAEEDGRVYLVERHVESAAELEGLCAAYVEHSEEADRPAILASRDLLDTLCAEEA